MRGRTLKGVVVGATSLALLLPAAEGAIADGREKVNRGSCGGSTKWKLQAEHDDGKIEVEYEVTSPKAGQKWRVVLRHDGNPIFKGTKTTRRDDDDRPDFEVERRVGDHKGIDRFKARAKNTATGRVCKGSVSL